MKIASLNLFFNPINSAPSSKSILLTTIKVSFVFAPIEFKTSFTVWSWASKKVELASTTSKSKSESIASLSVLLNEATRPCGSLRINPTESLIRTSFFPPIWRVLTVVSRVANSWFFINTLAPVRALSKVDFPALV